MKMGAKFEALSDEQKTKVATLTAMFGALMTEIMTAAKKGGGKDDEHK